MISYTGSRNLFGVLTNNNATANLTVGDTLINNAARQILRSRSWYFLNKSDTSLTTTASTQFYTLPNDCESILTVSITVGTFVYTPKECPSREFWNKLNETTSFSSNYPEYYYVFAGRIGFWPIPSTSSYTITLYYKRKIRDLGIADYTTGTITSIANGGTAVVGSGTTWTAKMAGRFIQFTDSNTANTGDGFWYEISSVASTTSLTLVTPYGGTAISAGSAAYTIGQISIIPEDFQELPVYKAAQIYFSSIQPEPVRAKLYEGMYETGFSEMASQVSSPTVSPVIEEGDGFIRNPNSYPVNLS